MQTSFDELYNRLVNAAVHDKLSREVKDVRQSVILIPTSSTVCSILKNTLSSGASDSAAARMKKLHASVHACLTRFRARKKVISKLTMINALDAASAWIAARPKN